MTRRDPPPNLGSLTKRIANLAADTGRPVRRIQRAVANTVIGQTLPPGVVKGGTALKLRVGEAGSRFTPDLDVARSASVSLEDYLDALDENLAVGWSGFTGRIVVLDPAEPDGVPTATIAISDSATALRTSVVARNRFRATWAFKISSSPGSLTGAAPALSSSTLDWSISTPMTECPSWLKQAAVTAPT